MFFQTKKNWLPLVFGPALAMATVSGRIGRAGQVLVVELVAGAAGSGAGGVAALQHEDALQGQPVAVRAVEVAPRWARNRNENVVHGACAGQRPERDQALGGVQPGDVGPGGPAWR